ncbi:hypothetical protein LINPERPRIM_LOCUS14832, partial [Linum perenne]
MSLSHSTWPIVLMPYNTPPWECMKSTGMILSSIVPGKKAPGNDIDVYLQPLVDELKMLWEGVGCTHLVEEVRLGGPVYYRWMYPIERFLGKLKSFVRNRSQPEGLIAEVWISEEIITFASLYYEDGVETRFNRGSRLHDQVRDESLGISRFPSIGRHVGGEHPYKLNDMEWLQAHRHVLIGANKVSPFLQEFQAITKHRLRGRSVAEVEKAIHRDFVQWFRSRILDDTEVVHSNNLRLLAR